METRAFDRETLLDLTVNAIPLFMIGFFLLLFVLVRPFPRDFFSFVIMVGLHVVPFVSLIILTYFSARAISRSEAEMEATTAPAGSDDFAGGEANVDRAGDTAPDATEGGAESAIEPSDEASDRHD
jgi:hypothetical protein